MEGQVPLEKGLKGTNDPTKPWDLDVKPNQSMRERLHEPRPERKIKDRERYPTHFKSSPKSIIDLHHFRKEAWYVESLSKWRNLQNVLLTSLKKRPILVDLSRCLNWLEKYISYKRKTTKGAFKDKFPRKRNKQEREWKKNAQSFNTRASSKIKAKEKIVILRKGPAGIIHGRKTTSREWNHPWKKNNK